MLCFLHKVLEIRVDPYLLQGNDVLGRLGNFMGNGVEAWHAMFQNPFETPSQDSAAQ